MFLIFNLSTQEYPAAGLKSVLEPSMTPRSCCEGAREILLELTNIRKEVTNLTSLVRRSLQNKFTDVKSECAGAASKFRCQCNWFCVFVAIGSCGSQKTINSFSNSIYDRLISPGTSQDLQWRSSECGGDCRQFDF